MRTSLAFPFLVSAVVGACATSPPDPDLGSTDQSVWVNGDFENDPIGTTPPSGWTRQTYLNPGITDTRPTPQTLASLNLGAGGVAMSSVVGGAPESQTDPDIRANGSLRFPKYGQRAAVVNYLSASSPGKDRNVNALRQTMTIGLGDVDPTDDKVHVRFAIAPVLENPTHAYHEQPYYFVRLHNVTTGATLYQDFNASGQPGVPWKDFTSLAGNASQYTDWQLVDIAPGNAGLAVGDQVELLVIAGGCSLGGHWGRVYVDAVGSGIPGLFAWATGPQQVNAGDDITYTVHYKNGGTTTTTGTKLDLVTPPNTTFQATSLGAACTTPAVGATGTVSCSLGSLANGGTGSFTIRVKVPAGTVNGTRITNGTYSIYATGISALIGPKVYTNVTSSVAYADVSVSVTDGLAAIGWGQPIRYTIQVSNAGPMAAPVVVQDTLPPQLVNATWTCAGTGGATCTTSGTGNLLETVQLPAGGVATFTIDAQVVAGTGAGTLKNTATATVGGGITDPDSTGNTAVDLTQIGTPRTLTVSKSGAPALGSLHSTPSSLSCGLACSSASAEFLDGTPVVLTATPAPGSTFTGWGGACSGTATTCTVTMNGAQGVTASFVGAPAAVVTGGDGQATPIGTPFGAPLTVTVVDANGAPIPNVTVSFAAPASGASAVLGATTATTNSAGQVAISATANLTPGSYVVIATVPGIAGPIEIALSNLGTPASIAIVGGNAQSTAVTTAFATPLLVVVRDAVNQPLPNIAVAFAAPASGPSAALLATATTDAFGVALTTATANQRAGGYQVTAAIPGASVAFSLTNLAGPAATVTVIGGGGQQAEVGSSFGDPIVVEVRDAFGNPVPGAAVDFGAPGSGPTAGFSPSPATTGPDGRATVTGTAGSTAGTYDIEISSGSATPATISLTNAPGAPATVEIIGGDPQTAVVTEAFGAPLRVRVRDAHGNPVPGASVAFQAPTSSASAQLSAPAATTDATGHAEVTATANAIAGAYAIGVAIPGGATAAFQLTNLPGAPAVVRAASASSPQSTTVLTAFAEPLAVTVEDAHGNLVPGAQVQLTAPSSGASATLDHTTASTDASGRASVLATASATAGSYVVTASVTGASPATFALTNLAGAPATVAVSGGSGQSTVVDTAFPQPLAVAVRDAHGNPVGSVVVSFAAPAGSPTALLAASSALTGANGIASVLATADTHTGSYVVTATIPGGAAPAEFALTHTAGAPATLAIAPTSTPQSATVNTPYAQPLVATLADAFGNPVPGRSVAYAAPTTGPRGALSSASATTNAAGQASVTIVAGTVAGAFTVTASVGSLSGGFALTNLAGAATTITVVQGSSQTATVDTTFASALVARVTDAFGNPIANAPVEFAAPATGAAASLGTATTTTGANGQASTTAKANTISGAYAVTATTPNGSAPATFALQNRAGAPATAVATAQSTPQSAEIGHVFAHRLGVVVSDAFGNRVPGAQVAFAAPTTGASAGLSPATATTDGTGTATTQAIANTVTGAYQATATITGLAAPIAFELTHTSGPPRGIAVVDGGGQHAMATTAYDHELVLAVVDGFGNPAPGATIELVLPTTGPSATTPATTSVTGAGGEVRFPLTANDVVGTFEVVAQVAGAAANVRATMTNDEIPTTLTVDVPAEVPVDQPAELRATVAAQILTATGVVELVDASGAVVATGTLDGDGKAVLVVRPGSLGAFAYVARYAAQGPFGASSSSELSLVIGADSGTLSGGGCSATGGSTSWLGALLAIALIAWPRRRRLVAPAGALAAIGLAAAPARADIDAGTRSVDRLHAASADSEWFSLDSLTFGGPRPVTLGVVGDYAVRPLVVYDANDMPRANVVQDSLVLHVTASVSLGQRFRLGATVPFSTYQDGEPGTFNGMQLREPVAAFGDVSIAFDGRIHGDAHAPLRVAVGGRVILPTGSRTNYMSDGVIAGELRGLVAGELGRFEYAADLRIHLRDDTELAGVEFSHELRYGAAIGARLLDRKLLVGPELIGAIPLVADANGTPLEAALGAHYSIGSSLRVGLAAGVGLARATGTPDQRGMLSFAWMP